MVTRSERPRTMNNGSTTVAENFVYIPQSLKTRLQKKTKASLKTQKTDLKPFLIIVGANQRASEDLGHPYSYTLFSGTIFLEALNVC
jgi:hypothetical protein